MIGKRNVIIFISSAVGLYLLWYLLYDLWLMPGERVDKWLSQQVARGGAELLHWFNYNAKAIGRVIYLDDRKMVSISYACNGIEFLALFSGFILIYPGPWRKKLLFIPVGIILIHLLNVIRVAILAVNFQINHKTFSFNHRYTFSFLVYAFIFFMWMVWVNYFAEAHRSPAASVKG